MSSRKITLAINNIKKSIIFLRDVDKPIFKKTFRTLKFNKTVMEYAYSLGIYRISDVENKIDELVILYKNNGDRLCTLSRNLREVCKKYPGGNKIEIPAKDLNARFKGIVVNKNNATKKKETEKVVAKKVKPASKKMLRRIGKRAVNCCLCLKLYELEKLNEKEFVKFMKDQFQDLTGHKLETSRKNSWIDEFKQFKNVFIPCFRKYKHEILYYYVIFELKLPLKLSDLESDKYVYADAVIVGDDGVVVFEFKRLDSKTIDYDSKQANKYIHRLRHHKISARQHKRYVYVVYTKEKDDTIHAYKDKKDLSYGNQYAVAKDLCSKYFKYDKPLENIEDWLNAGFYKKKAKTKS